METDSGFRVTGPSRTMNWLHHLLDRAAVREKGVKEMFSATQRRTIAISELRRYHYYVSTWIMLLPFKNVWIILKIAAPPPENSDKDRALFCSEKTNSSSSRDVGPACSRDEGSTCFNIIQSPCFELIPEEECVERFWYGWCKSYRPISVAVIHHPIHHDCGADNLNEDEEEEEEESKPPIPTQVGPPTTTTPADPVMGTITSTPDSAAPITIWRSESPTGKSQGHKVIKKVKKKKEKEKDKEEDTDEKPKPKKKVKKGKLIKKKSPVKSESSPPDLSRSVSPRELTRMSESSPDSRGDLESEDSYNDPRREEPSSEDILESSSPRKREKNAIQTKKPGAKASPVKKVKRKSPPASNPNLS
ncbi:protein PROCA1-like [Vulpes vulpes]|uniref:Protein PROCA1-like n=1 Tax=Vulpes vulpes TaxID=9627 RepID=A0A3Q7TPB1_VULVU